MTNKLRQLWAHIVEHREVYVFPALIILAVYAAICFVVSLTGRAVIDDPGAIVGWLYSAVRAVIVVGLTGITQHHFIGYRGKETKFDDCFDTVVTFILLGFFAHLIQ